MNFLLLMKVRMLLPEVKNDNEFDWKDFVDNSINPSTGSYSAGGEDREQFDSIATKVDTFVDHLFWQLRLHDFKRQGDGDRRIHYRKPES